MPESGAAALPSPISSRASKTLISRIGSSRQNRLGRSVWGSDEERGDGSEATRLDVNDQLRDSWLMFRNGRAARSWQREFDAKEDDARVAAREATSGILGAIVSHPDTQAPKACVIATAESGYRLFKLAWDPGSEEYFLDEDTTLIVREVTDSTSVELAEQEGADWVAPDEATTLDFRNIPGVFQDALVAYVTGMSVPTSPVSFIWAPSYGGQEPDWMVRRFPPPPGEPQGLYWSALPRDVVMSWYEERGW